MQSCFAQQLLHWILYFELHVLTRSIGLNTLPGILQRLTVILPQLPDDASAVVFNQDCIGVFTSIPAFRILNARALSS